MACIRAKVTQRLEIVHVSNQHLGIITAMDNEYLEWVPEYVHHHFCVCHLASNIHCMSHDKSVMMLLVRVAYGRRPTSSTTGYTWMPTGHFAGKMGFIPVVEGMGR